MATTVVNIKTGEPFDIFIGRPSKFGNPYSHLPKSAAKFRVKTRQEAVEKYREYIMGRPDLLADIEQLRGKILGCFCHPATCHGDVLAELANELVDK